ncbi:hypothetical protein THAOC_20513 [Thalassiosira oceanica]|uniref:Uncharacterized protein n=1 Tax=Thalassiosira oceanica TaxID=159749 RepID=K0SLD8_THAOC|nr:hypothetical protein THAOC_20513 [Thalassiosira oceanica]|eukprot:EJK59287.1 hypothetical protein THAOC_20513 [Thalassiosira oceanica]
MMICSAKRARWASGPVPRRASESPLTRAAPDEHRGSRERRRRSWTMNGPVLRRRDGRGPWKPWKDGRAIPNHAPPEAGDKEIKRTARDQAGVVDGRVPRATLRRSMDAGDRRRVSFFPPRRPSEDMTTDAETYDRGRASHKDERRRQAEEGWEKRDGRRIDTECPSSSARPDKGYIAGEGRDASDQHRVVLPLPRGLMA